MENILKAKILKIAFISKAIRKIDAYVHLPLRCLDI